MIEVGKYQTLTVARQVDFGVYLTDGNDEVLLPSKYIPSGAKIGSTIEVFVYTDSEDRPIATNLKPYAQAGEFAYLLVKSVSKFGAFMDIGLEKDLLVPFREQAVKMQEGRKYVVKVMLDHRSGRMIGVGKIDPLLSKETTTLVENEEVGIMVWQPSDLGFKVIISGQFQGLLYHNEIFQELQVGDCLKAYVKKIRDDGKIDVSLQKSGYQAVKDMSTIVLDKIKEAGGTLKLGDKSDPEAIKQSLGMSKKNFKKILGGLYKSGLVEIRDDQVKLKKES